MIKLVKVPGFLLLTLFLFCNILNAQVAVNLTGNLPDNSAMMDIGSTVSGFLPPRLTSTQRNLIPSPATGLMIYNLSTNHFNYFNGTEWNEMGNIFVTLRNGSIRNGKGISFSASPGHPADSSAIFDISDPSRGLLLPRTTPSDIPSPATGLIIYDNLSNKFTYFDGTTWIIPCTTPTGITGASGSQSSIGIPVKMDSSPADPSAILDVSSASKGFLIPRMTNEQRNAIFAVQGLTIYNTTSNTIEFYTGTEWNGLNHNYPGISGEIEGPVSVCHGTTQIYITAEVENASYYLWTVPEGWTIESGQGSRSIKATPGVNAVDGLVSYTPSNACGTGTLVSLYVSVDTLMPSVFITVSPSNAVCESQDSGLVFTAHSSTGGTNPVFTWYKNGIPVTGITGNTLIADVSDNDRFYCSMTSDIPCADEEQAVSNTIIITVYPTPDTSPISF